MLPRDCAFLLREMKNGCAAAKKILCPVLPEGCIVFAMKARQFSCMLTVIPFRCKGPERSDVSERIKLVFSKGKSKGKVDGGRLRLRLKLRIANLRKKSSSQIRNAHHCLSKAAVIGIRLRLRFKLRLRIRSLKKSAIRNLC
jgi:hypothetical protein